MQNLTLLLALLAALALAAAQTQGINPVQHSEGVTTQNASKGINPVQHSE
jgi:hypothetical protein